jgi:hypothetical protein
MPGKGSLDIGVVCKSTTDQEYIARNLKSITSTPDELGWIQANSTDFVRYGIMQHSGETSPNIPVLIHVLTRENPRLAEFLIIQLLSRYPSFFHEYKAVKERAFESQDRFVYGRARREFLGTVTSYALDTIRPYLPQSSGEIDPNIEMSTFLIEQLNSPDTFVQSEAGKALNLFANNHFRSMQKALYQAP